MEQPLRLLVVDDDQADAELIVRKIRKSHGACEHRCVASMDAVIDALRAFVPDLAITDHRLLGFSGYEALSVILREMPGLPVIVVTGSLGDEGAADYIKQGATDFLLKKHLQRLGPAVTRALALRDAREGHRRAEDRLRAEQERLRAEQERQRAFFEASPLPMWIYDRSSLEVVDVNDAAVEHYGYTRDEFLRLSLRDLRPASEVPHLEDALAGEIARRHYAGLWKHRKKDGSIIDVEVVTTDLMLAGRTLRIAALNDITERLRIAAEMEESQRMEAIGRLAGGVAHDFNNLLTVVEASSELLLADLPSQSALREDLEMIHNASREAAALTRQLLAFSHRQVLAPAVLNLNRFIPETHKMLGRLLGARVTLRAALAPDLGDVTLDPSQVQQILVNLAVNARDAMPDGGTITIETANLRVDASAPGRTEGEEPGEYVVLRVSDTGVGMDAATRARIFEPFFTTKERGKGTGLGLATVYGIVQQGGGHIRVRSAPGEGASFEVCLPRVWAAAEPPRVANGAAQARGTESVLIVEDDEAVRRLLVRCLRLQGYRVVDAGNAADAMQLAATDPGPLHLLLTDIMMPGASGPELARRLREQLPSLAVLFVSGYVEDGIVRDAAVRSGFAILQKPFGPHELAQAVRKTLDGGRRTADGRR